MSLAPSVNKASQGDLPMTEQMTGRKDTAGPESPAGSPASSSASAVPSPRDLAARSPHRDAARAAEPSHEQTPAPAAEPPRAHVPSPGRVRATGAQALVYALERVGADVVFGIPGGAVLPAYDPLLDSKTIRHILVRHEQGAGHAATATAHATGRVGDGRDQVRRARAAGRHAHADAPGGLRVPGGRVARGPGATNLVTPI